MSKAIKTSLPLLLAGTEAALEDPFGQLQARNLQAVKLALSLSVRKLNRSAIAIGEHPRTPLDRPKILSRL